MFGSCIAGLEATRFGDGPLTADSRETCCHENVEVKILCFRIMPMGNEACFALCIIFDLLSSILVFEGVCTALTCSPIGHNYTMT